MAISFIEGKLKAALLDSFEAYLDAPVKLAAPPPPSAPRGPSGAVPKAGETIAQQAHAAGQHVPGGHGAPKKVATPLGEKKYGVPIGSLIIPHTHFVKGEPSHWIPNVSEEKWIQNQWGGKEKAAEAAKKAVAAGTHHWVHAAGQTYAVKNGLDVHVPKGINAGDPDQVKNAPKTVVKHGDNPEHVTLGPHLGFQPYQHTAADHDQLEKDYQKLPEPESKKSVAFEGKHAAWVPSDWKVYKKAGADESTLAAKFAKDPQGHWHHIGKNGGVDQGPFTNKNDKFGGPEAWVKSGGIVPDDDHPAPHPDHQAPSGSPGPESPKVHVGGVPVTKQEIQQAITKLQGSASTQIKGLLKGHPLEASDYHSVYKGELAKFPELAVSSGTKKAHVGQAKLAFIHHLAGALDQLSKTEAEQDAAQQAADKAEADAAHAQELTPHQHTMGAVPKAKPPGNVFIPAILPGGGPGSSQIGVNEAEIKQAIDLLHANQSTSVKQPLQKAGNPLWQMDYHKINQQMLAQHPELKVAKGTKQAHVGQVKTSVLKFLEDKLAEFKQGGKEVSKEQAQELIQMLEAGEGGNIGVFQSKLKKAGNPLGEVDLLGLAKQYKAEHPNTAAGLTIAQMLIAYLKEHHGDMAAADAATGHDEAAQVHELLMDGQTDWGKASLSPDGHGAVAQALSLAAKNNGTYHAQLSSEPGLWKVTKFPNPDKAYYSASPQHKVTAHLPGVEPYQWSPGQVADAVKQWVKPLPEGGTAPKPLEEVLQAAVPAKPPPPSAVPTPDQWAKEPEFPAIHNLVTAAGPDTGKLPDDTNSALAKALWLTGKLGTVRWLYADDKGNWTLASHKPLPGTWGAQTAAGFYQVTSYHQIIHTDVQGHETGLPGGQVLEIAQLLKPGEKPAADGGFDVTASGNTYHAPAGSHVYVNPQHPDLNPGTEWADVKYVHEPDGAWVIVQKKAPGLGIQHVSKPVGGSFDADVTKGGLVPWPPEQPGVPVVIGGKTVFTAPPGTTLWKFSTSKVHDPAEVAGAKVYMKYPDGTWHFTSQFLGDKPKASANAKETLDGFAATGKMPPYGPAAQAVADAAQLPKVDVAPPEDEPPDAGPGTDVTVTIKGQEAAKVPAGSKVYWYPNGKAVIKGNEDAAAPKYVKYPDGSWHDVYSAADGASAAVANPAIYDNYVAQGKFVEVGTAPDPEKAVPSAVPIPLIYEGAAVGEAPAGSQLYQKDSYGIPYLYVKQPDGSWSKVTSSGLSGGYGNLDSQVESGLLTPAKIPSAADVAHAAEIGHLKQLLKTGSVTKAESGKSWQAMLAYVLAGYSVPSETTLYQGLTAGKWLAGGSYNVPAGKDYYTFNTKTLEGVHHVPGAADEPVPFEQAKAAIEANVVPGTVLLGGKPVKHGFWYNPKGKAFLEITPGGGYKAYKFGNAGKASYTWHGVDGSVKDVTATFAEKQLEKNTEWHAQPKALETKLPAAKAPDYATAYGPGAYILWAEHAAPGDVLQVHSDGTASFSHNGVAAALSPEHLSGLTQGGAILDQHGNSLVKPGEALAYVHIFGGAAKTPAQVKDLLDKMEAATGSEDGKAWHQPFVDFFGGQDGYEKIHPAGKAFMEAHGAASGTSQLEAVKALLRELLGVPGQKAAKAAEPVFLKSMPPGIHSAKDIFTFTGQGNAEPKVKVFGTDLYGIKPAMAAKIKAISAAFGDGKVVGTHISGLSSQEHIDWLQAWKSGDMAAVFALDAKGGKVSPAHPGAPGSPDTHHVDWAPLDPAQVPASKVIEGTWTAPDITMPPAELDNYLIKVGFQHGEYLLKSEKPQLVSAHRSHNQEAVDKITALVEQRFAEGQTPASYPLKWTDGLVPAKAYDAYLAENVSPTGWSTAGVDAFTKDFQAELLPLAQQIVTQQGSSMSAQEWLDGSPYYQKQVIQKWMDAKHEAWVAEQSAPVWKQTPGANPPQATHPIYDLTKTIPLTHDVSQWYFKPVPAGKEFLAEQEHAAAQLGHVWGFKTPGSDLIHFDGQYGQAQRKLPALGDLSYGKPLGFYDDAPIPFGELTQRQVSDIAKEHLFDWALDNNDGRASNFLRMPDGSVVGIDKGRAWASWGTWKGLAGNAEADQQSRQVSGQLYDAIRSHAISKEMADQAYIDVIRQARKMAKLPDDRERAILEQAFAHRAKWGSLSKAKVIQAALDRKNSLEQDFTDLYQRVYKDAGWELPEVPAAKLGETPAGVALHSGFSEPDFIDHVHGNKSFGAAAFFAGPDVEYGHALVWREYAGSGTKAPVLRGSMGARGQGLKNLVAWAKSHLLPGQNEDAPYVPPADTQTVYPSASGLPGMVKGSSLDRGQLTGEKELYNNIILAARHVSKHAVDKQFKTPVLEILAQAKEKLTGTLKGLEAVPPDNEWRQAAEPVVKLYLDYVGQVETAKDTGGTFKNGDLPRYYKAEEAKPKPAEKPKPAPAVKVELASPHRPTGSVGNDGELHTSTSSTSYQDGHKVYKITLPDGEVIELFATGDGPDTYSGLQQSLKNEGFSSGGGNAMAHWGHIKFRAVHEDGAASLERIRAQLQEMGLPLDEATPEDMELYYWRHLYNVLEDRQDGPNGTSYSASSKYAKVVKAVNAARKQHGITGPLERGGLDPGTELAVWRDAWANLTSPEQVAGFTEAGGHLPHFKHYNVRNPNAAGGVPIWHRFDVTREMLQGQKMPDHVFVSHPKEGATRIVTSGGQYAKDFRFDHLALDISGQSNPSSTGSTGFVFGNINSEEGHVLASPVTLARTTNYGWSGDHYGDVSDRLHSAYFDPQLSWQWQGMETMFPGAWSLLDDIEAVRASSEEQRQEIIKHLQSLGIDEIRGLKVEDRIGTHSTWYSVKKKIREHWKAHPELLDPHAAEVPSEFTPAALPTEAGAKAAESGQAAQAAVHPLDWQQSGTSGKVWNAGEYQVVKSGSGYDLWKSGSLVGDYTSMDAAMKAAEDDSAGKAVTGAAFEFYGKSWPAGTKVYKWTQGQGTGRVVVTPDGQHKMVFPNGNMDDLGEHTFIAWQSLGQLEDITPGGTAGLTVPAGVAYSETMKEGMVSFTNAIQDISEKMKAASEAYQHFQSSYGNAQDSFGNLYVNPNATSGNGYKASWQYVPGKVEFATVTSGSITSADIKSGSITAAEIKPGAVITVDFDDLLEKISGDADGDGLDGAITGT